MRIFEPKDGWSLANLRKEHGEGPLRQFAAEFPTLSSTAYDPKSIDLEEELDGVDLVVVHEWNSPELVKAIGEMRTRTAGFRLLFHDTHHRCITRPSDMAAYQLKDYDGVLAFGEAIRQVYLDRRWTSRCWTWHEAADTRRFYPRNREEKGDLVWIGNWGDDERKEELRSFLIDPVRELKLRGAVHGVRYPREARRALKEANLNYGGWLPNHQVPETFAQYRFTVHVPRRPYVEALPGIPTIRVFEALACGIPLISAPWEDAEHLFRPGDDYLVARTGREMKQWMDALVNDDDLAQSLVEEGRRTILERHTCAHRVDELMEICAELGLAGDGRSRGGCVGCEALEKGGGQ